MTRLLKSETVSSTSNYPPQHLTAYREILPIPKSSRLQIFGPIFGPVAMTLSSDLPRRIARSTMAALPIRRCEGEAVVVYNRRVLVL